MPDSIEVQFARLDERFNNLEKVQHDNHQEILKKLEDLTDGTSYKINRLEERVDSLEKWRVARTEQIKESSNNLKIYFGIGTFILLLIVGLLIWHITGGTGGFHI